MVRYLIQPGWYFIKQKFKVCDSQRPGAWLQGAGEELLIVTGHLLSPQGRKKHCGATVMATSQRPLCSLLLPRSGSLLAGRGSGVYGSGWGWGWGSGACCRTEELEVGQGRGKEVWRILRLVLSEWARLVASRIARAAGRGFLAQESARSSLVLPLSPAILPSSALLCSR